MEFQRGSPANEIDRQEDEGPQHWVRITQPYYLGVHEVTKGQFAAFVNAKNYQTAAERDGRGGYGLNAEGKYEQKPEYTWKNGGFTQTDDHPVMNVTWNDAVAFAECLMRKTGTNSPLSCLSSASEPVPNIAPSDFRHFQRHPLEVYEDGK